MTHFTMNVTIGLLAPALVPETSSGKKKFAIGIVGFVFVPSNFYSG